MSIGLIGRKVGVTQVFQDDGTMVAVSVVAIQPNTVTRLRTADRDGYTAVQLGTDVAKKLNKPESGQLKDLPKVATVREFRVDAVDDYEVGQTLSVEDMFSAGDLVDVTGVSKGKGFAGVIKRHKFSSNRASHGNSITTRAPGSIGQAQDPGRVFPGKKMPGHLGNKRRTAQNLEVVRIDAERKLLLVRGAVPGHAGGAITVAPSTKARA